MSEIVGRLTEARAIKPAAIAEALNTRRRRPLLGAGGTLFLLAADHPARGIVKVGENPMAMADRGDYLERIVTALDRPGVDGIMATPDIVDDLALLSALDEKVVIGSMNRGGLAGAVFELDDRFTGYTVEGIVGANLDGGKMLLRIADDDRDPLDVAEKAADRVKHVHLKDVDREVARRLGAREIGFKEACMEEAFRPLGDGDVDVARLLEILDRSNYSGWYVLEQDIMVENKPPEGEGPVNDIRKSLQFLETTLEGSRKTRQR